MKRTFNSSKSFVKYSLNCVNGLVAHIHKTKYGFYGGGSDNFYSSMFFFFFDFSFYDFFFSFNSVCQSCVQTLVF